MSPTPARPVPESRATTEGALSRALRGPLGAERARAECVALLDGLETAADRGAIAAGLRLLAARVAAWEAAGVPVAGVEDALAAIARGPWLRGGDAPLEDMLVHEIDQRQKLGALLTVSRAVVNSLDLDTILGTISRNIRQVIPADDCVVFLRDETEQSLVPVLCDAADHVAATLAVRLRLGEGLAGAVAQSAQGALVSDTSTDPRTAGAVGTPLEPSSLLCVPLVSRDRTLGAILLSCSHPNAFQQDDLELATLFADPCAAAIANARLYDRMRQAYDEVRAAQTQLVQSAKLNALGEMAGGVAHDFNNILAAILGRTQLLMQSVSDPEVRRQLGVIEQAAMDGAQTVRRVQEFTRVRQDERFETLDVNRVLAGVVELTRPAWEAGAKRQGILVDVHLDLRSTHTIAGAASELSEVFTNMVLNAVDAMPMGGDLWIASRDEGDHVRVQVRDSGIGMDAETLARVFDPFFTTKDVKGTGLGLSVAYGIATRHRAHIDVQSAPGQGTVFTVTFPTGAVAPEEPAAAPGPPPSTLRILVADDEESVLSVLTEILRGLGHDVVPALGGPAAIEALRAHTFDLVFTDLGMPEVNGWDLAAAVKAKSPECAVVLVSGWGFQLEEEATHSRGVDLVLPKPFSFEDVEHTLATLFTPEGRRRAA